MHRIVMDEADAQSGRLLAGGIAECKHAFVTSQGTPYGRFRRALDTGNVLGALSAAAELEQVGLTDALELVLLIRDKAPDKFGRAAVRWHGRYCREVRDVGIEEAQAVLALLALLPGGKRVPAAHALADLFDRRQLGQAAALLMRSAGGS